MKTLIAAIALLGFASFAHARVEIYSCRAVISKREANFQLNGKNAFLDGKKFVSSGLQRVKEDGGVELFDLGSLQLEVYNLKPQTGVRDVNIIDKSDGRSDRLVCRLTGAQG